jgi:predicted LPLAT superfamily acyltransferase
VSPTDSSGAPADDTAGRGGRRSAAWAQFGERGSSVMLRVMVWISLRLGRRPARAVLLGIAGYFLVFAPKARRASAAFLTRALGRPPTWRERFRHIHTFASTIHDRVFLLNDRADLFDLELRGVEHIEAALAQGRGALLMGAHFGSFEVLRAAGRLRGRLSIALLMYPDNARKINAALHAINPAAEQEIIALGRADSMLRVNQALDAGSVVGILADRAVRDDAIAHRRFLGADAPWPLGPLRMAVLLKRPVLFVAGIYRGGSRYTITFEPLPDLTGAGRQQRAEAVQRSLDRYVELLEQHCREAPDNWFNFFDFWDSGSRGGAASTAPCPPPP